ncbi:YfhO family protein [Salimicrobium jeotgali]|uniref:YfhO family protein n=1 Tax=Salimicrobium jeotgali TaxID=1230341 RepID=UPI000C83E631|nr:YfhO family protein [Salimicrobium jeotgali]
MTKKQLITLVTFSLVISALAHGFFLYQWSEGHYMVGPNDGLSQMVPFKQMLYEQFTGGDFFYSYQFGLGGDVYSQLAYYFSVNLFFYLTVAVVFLLETFSVISEPDVLFWAQSAVFLSVIRMSFVIITTTFVFRYFTGKLVPSFVGAVFFATAAKYFQHVTYWEFFGDAFLWLPLLILGAEKVIRENRPGWLIAATAVSFFDNFYFAYINGFFIVIYILLRWLLPLRKKELPKFSQIKVYIMAVLLGFGIGAAGFVPAVRSFLQNVRPPYTDEIPLIESTTNILYDSLYLMVPALFVLMLVLRPLYKNKNFRFFAVLGLIIIVLHYIPYAASFFNGLSAPQHRYEYLAAFAIGGAIASGLPELRRIKGKELLTGGAFTAVLYVLFLVTDHGLAWPDEWALLFLTWAGFTVLAAFATTRYGKKGFFFLIIGTITFQLLSMNMYQWDKLYTGGEVYKSSKDYITSEDYRGKEQRELIERTMKDAGFSRISWMADGRYNTPLIQDFYGTSAYSSILNGNLLNYYYHDLEIDMKKESVSRYAGFGDRANLHSLWQGDYFMYEKDSVKNVPYGFKPASESDNYIIYKNTNSLPFVQTSGTIYSEEGLEESHPLAREAAMIDGMVIEGADSTAASPPVRNNYIESTGITTSGATYNNDTLHVQEKEGGIDLTLPDSVMNSDSEDIYVSFHLLNNDEEAPWFALYVNDFRTSRKSEDSIYKTDVNDITIRVPKEKEISIRMRKGEYTLKDLEVYAEDYQKLEEAAAKEKPGNVEIDDNHITIDSLDVDEKGYLSIPVPYEEGWSVKVDGEKRETVQANYAMTGTALKPGDEIVEFTYRPPYFDLLIILSLISAASSIGWLFIRRRKI